MAPKRRCAAKVTSTSSEVIVLVFARAPAIPTETMDRLVFASAQSTETMGVFWWFSHLPLWKMMEFVSWDDYSQGIYRNHMVFLYPMTDPWCCYIWCAMDPIFLFPLDFPLPGLVSTFSYGKSQSLISKSTLNGPCSITMLNHQRVNTASGHPTIF